jgi:hypothetical protein
MVVWTLTGMGLLQLDSSNSLKSFFSNDELMTVMWVDGIRNFEV